MMKSKGEQNGIKTKAASDSPLERSGEVCSSGKLANTPQPQHTPSLPLSRGELDIVCKAYSNELKQELNNIISYWQKDAPDNVNGGFYGKIDNENNVTKQAPKGSVLNTRILWSFSAAYNQKPNAGLLQMANRAYTYINKRFIDHEFGGVYWSVDYNGAPLDTKKQVYASAFALYALSEYYMASGIETVKQQAINLYRLLVDKSFDTERTGYLEAFTREWQPISDLRLSAKDANEKKTMNTHLHILEAYTNLYRIWPNIDLKEQITILVDNFLDHFIDVSTNHLLLFFDEEWNSRADTVSYGHDIEATWLLLEAAEVIGDVERVTAIKKICMEIADATIPGIDSDGGLWYEYEPVGNHLIKEKHWWVQAEAVVGFFNAWQVSGDQKYLNLSLNTWAFVKDKILDKQHGEWFWGINAYGNVMPGEDKAGLWKCPYHNSRACLEIIKRTS
ncbi:mannobiose 2-epimerase [Mucilaginibacter pineti]|uniref:Cellobiose 2-epimerase n=1 Tax=Mucilaginibacter pineti TaxID=1391627 RepID=A0A1G7BL60_9SPHI|nr:AGE family epimerase/isomerase [Mucilaginibacter pineti]SDE27045.1 mannobiose 2-epimerase [Mucilaginibacter pineti]